MDGKGKELRFTPLRLPPLAFLLSSSPLPLNPRTTHPRPLFPPNAPGAPYQLPSTSAPSPGAAPPSSPYPCQPLEFERLPSHSETGERSFVAISFVTFHLSRQELGEAFHEGATARKSGPTGFPEGIAELEEHRGGGKDGEVGTVEDDEVGVRRTYHSEDLGTLVGQERSPLVQPKGGELRAHLW